MIRVQMKGWKSIYEYLNQNSTFNVDTENSCYDFSLFYELPVFSNYLEFQQYVQIFGRKIFYVQLYLQILLL